MTAAALSLPESAPRGLYVLDRDSATSHGPGANTAACSLLSDRYIGSGDNHGGTVARPDKWVIRPTLNQYSGESRSSLFAGQFSAIAEYLSGSEPPLRRTFDRYTRLNSGRSRWARSRVGILYK